jgi:fumarate reductase subunit C
MAESPTYTDYHPRWLRRRLSTYWWLEKPSYLAFVLREGSCLFVGWFVVYLLLLMRVCCRAMPRIRNFSPGQRGQSVLVLNIISFLFLVYHAVTVLRCRTEGAGRSCRKDPCARMDRRCVALRGLARGVRCSCAGSCSGRRAAFLAKDGSSMIKRHPEPLLWMLFSAGGRRVAMLMPALVFLFGVAFPLGWLAPPDREHMRGLLATRSWRGPARPVRAVAVSLGAPLPSHAV